MARRKLKSFEELKDEHVKPIEVSPPWDGNDEYAEKEVAEVPADLAGPPVSLDGPPVEDVVKLAKALLEDAEAGRIIAVALAYVQRDFRTNSRSAAPQNDLTVLHALSSASHTMDWTLNKSIAGV